MRLMAEAVQNSVQALWVLIFFLVLGVVAFGSALYYTERMGCQGRDSFSDEDWQQYQQDCRDNQIAPDTFDPASGMWVKTVVQGVHFKWGLCCNKYDSSQEFPSIVATFWWAVVTMITVGYGDKYPKTALGKAVGSLSMFTGIVLIALPVAIVGSKFQEVYNAMEHKRIQNCGPGIAGWRRQQGIHPEGSPATRKMAATLADCIENLPEQFHKPYGRLCYLFDEAHATQIASSHMTEKIVEQRAIIRRQMSDFLTSLDPNLKTPRHCTAGAESSNAGAASSGHPPPQACPG
mmetsp:Transcript_30543/g.79080  ORF Transcript_30543/g.79080 Transcript_30543/m.79080 type:complete len:291 (+) Transcript_30543:196-1068(+)